MTSYSSSIDNISPSRTVFEIFDFKVFRVWPWPLTPKGHLGSKCFIPFESPYMTSYSTSIDNIFPSRTVLEIFDFKVFKVWPWPLNPKTSSGVKNIYTIRKPIYDCLYDFYEHHLSISYRFRDIRLQSLLGWTLTFDHKKSSRVQKNYTIRKFIYDFLFDFYEHHLSISYHFRDIRLQSFQGLTLTFDPKRSSGVKKIPTIREPI